MNETATAFAQAAKALEEGAAADKRAIAAHRRSLRARMQALDALRARCKELGIELEINTGQRRPQ